MQRREQVEPLSVVGLEENEMNVKEERRRGTKFDRVMRCRTRAVENEPEWGDDGSTALSWLAPTDLRSIPTHIHTITTSSSPSHYHIVTIITLSQHHHTITSSPSHYHNIITLSQHHHHHHTITLSPSSHYHNIIITITLSHFIAHSFTIPTNNGIMTDTSEDIWSSGCSQLCREAIVELWLSEKEQARRWVINE